MATSLDVTPRIYFENDIAVMVEMFSLYHPDFPILSRTIIKQKEDDGTLISYTPLIQNDLDLELEGRSNQEKQERIPINDILGQNYKSVKSLLESQGLRANYFERTEIPR